MTTPTKTSPAGGRSHQFTRFGVQWSSDNQYWLGIIKSKTLEEARISFRHNTAPHKRIVRHDITRTIIS